MKEIYNMSIFIYMSSDFSSACKPLIVDNICH